MSLAVRKQRAVSPPRACMCQHLAVRQVDELDAIIVACSGDAGPAWAEGHTAHRQREPGGHFVKLQAWQLVDLLRHAPRRKIFVIELGDSAACTPWNHLLPQEQPKPQHITRWEWRYLDKMSSVPHNHGRPLRMGSQACKLRCGGAGRCGNTSSRLVCLPYKNLTVSPTADYPEIGSLQGI